MAAVVEVEEEEDDEECPKCPPVGAPAWMATFADMATLLMAFCGVQHSKVQTDFGIFE
jgi:chemotaxis protein MotB